jgi:hypothetical protein
MAASRRSKRGAVLIVQHFTRNEDSMSTHSSRLTRRHVIGGGAAAIVAMDNDLVADTWWE